MTTLSQIAAPLLTALVITPFSAVAQSGQRSEANVVIEISFEAQRSHRNPFRGVDVDAEFSDPTGERSVVPAFWAGGNTWKIRYASPRTGTHRYRTTCNRDDPGLHGVKGTLEIRSYTGENPLVRHGPVRVAADRRHFAHADGKPFFWLGDTWWKGLCKRLTWDGFRELTADRKAKGFSVVQIVCGPYPDEEMFEGRWENEGGKPYEARDFSNVNPRYFEYSDRRIRHLIESGIVPAIVGGWGRPQRGGKSTVAQVGAEGYKRHWRHLIARYGAYPVVWIVGGEAKDAQGPWSEVAKHLKDVDPYHRPLTYHAPGHPRRAIQDNAVFDFDMPAIGHNGLETAKRTLDLIKSCRSQKPTRPVLCGEACYEGHMQTNFQYLQRHLFWSFILSGAAGHTYGAAGIWQASIEGDPGITPVYDLTTWREGMNYVGSTQLGLGKRLLEKYPWSRFEPHPEWVEKDCFAAGIPGKVRMVYKPRRNIYDWRGPKVTGLDPTVDWNVFYFDPATGRTIGQGTIEASANASGGNAKPVEFQKNVPSPQDWVLVFEAIRRAKPPNVVFIMADDLGYGDLSCYGATHFATPSCDRLAEKGMRFTDAHSPSAVCTPTRYSVLTGRYCWRTWLKNWVLFEQHPLLIDTDRLTMGRMFQHKGYTTGCVGKWHLGWGTDLNPDYSGETKPGPLEVGFDTFFGVPFSHNSSKALQVYVRDRRIVGLEPGLAYKSPAAMKQTVRKLEDTAIRLSKEAVAFVERNKTKPFFLYYPTTNIHFPLTPNSRFKGSTRSGIYGEFVVEFDWAVGQLLDALDRNGLTDETIVVLTSDNGARPHRSLNGHECNGPWRGTKRHIYEGGHRVPLIVRWPGKVEPGTVSEETVCLTDFFATFAAMLDHPVPRDAGEDSYDITSALLGQKRDRPLREATVHHSVSGQFAIRKGDWKLIEGKGNGDYPRDAKGRMKVATRIPTRDTKTGRIVELDYFDLPRDEGVQLYNLKKDPAERDDLSDKHPEKVEELLQLLNRYRKSGRSTESP